MECDMLEIEKIHFHIIEKSLQLYGELGYWIQFWAKGALLVWHPFCLENACFYWIVKGVLHLGKNLNSLQVFR